MYSNSGLCSRCLFVVTCINRTVSGSSCGWQEKLCFMQTEDLKIVMVDDSDIDRFIVKRSLQIFGLQCELIEFSSPVKFLEWLEGQVNQPADLAIVDLNMPGIDGFQVIKKI